LWFSPFGGGKCATDMTTAAQFLENSYTAPTASPSCTPSDYSKTPPVVGSCVFYPPVVWVGAGCPRPCATKAIQAGKNPMRYCRSIHTWPTFNDGGCKLYFDCNIGCADTCKRHRVSTRRPFNNFYKNTKTQKTNPFILFSTVL
jgi:hypothetical protein